MATSGRGLPPAPLMLNVLPVLRAVRMRQLRHELLPGTNRRENQEFETNVPAAHGSTATFF
jgi:hypothetical protein